MACLVLLVVLLLLMLLNILLLAVLFVRLDNFPDSRGEVKGNGIA